MFNRSQIMMDAWALYYRKANRYWTHDRRLFGRCLKQIWEEAKSEPVEIAPTVEAAVAGKNAAQIIAIRSQIDALKYKSLRYDIEPMRRELETRIADLMAA